MYSNAFVCIKERWLQNHAHICSPVECTHTLIWNHCANFAECNPNFTARLFCRFFSGDFLSHSMFRTSEVIQCMWFWYWNEWIKMKIRWSRWFEMPTEQNAADSCETWKLHVFKITGLLRFCVLAKWAYQV